MIGTWVFLVLQGLMAAGDGAFGVPGTRSLVRGIERPPPQWEDGQVILMGSVVRSADNGLLVAKPAYDRGKQSLEIGR